METTDTADVPPNPKIKGLSKVFAGVGMLVAAFAWMAFGEDMYGPWLHASWLKWFGRQWFEGPPGFSTAAVIILQVLPFFMLMGGGLVLIAWFSATNMTLRHKKNLDALDHAKIALQQGILSIGSLERDYRNKLAAFESLQAQIDNLEAVRGVDVEDLRKKLGAIALANRRSVWFERFMGFVLGVGASLIATVIWEKVVRVL